MKTEVELTEYVENGSWNCTVTMPDGQVLDACEVFSDNGSDIARETLRDMSGHEPRNL